MGGSNNVEDQDTSNYINCFFTNIGPKLALNHTEQWEFHGEKVAEKCPIFEMNYDQVLRLCRDIKTIKSSGFSDIPSRIFKEALKVIIPQLVYLFNLSFTTGVFPNKWKRATIIPLYKGDRTEVGNYRPVSLLPLPGKLIEKIAHAKMSSFLDQHRVISEKQGGFRKGFSTASSIADLTNPLFNNINNGLTSLAAFINLSKAFDTVNHEIPSKQDTCFTTSLTGVQLIVKLE